jgi:hypothetical protein
MERKKSRKARILLYILGGLLLIGVAGYFIAQSAIRQKIATALKDLPPAFAVSYSSIEPGLLSGSMVIRDLKVRFTPGADTDRQHEVSLDRLDVRGISYLSWLSSHRLRIGLIRLEGVRVELDDYLLEKKIPFPEMQGPGRLTFGEVTLERLELAGVKAGVYKGEWGGVGDPKGEKQARLSKETMAFEGSLSVYDIILNDLTHPIDTANLHFGKIRLLASNVRYLVPGAYEEIRLSGIELNSGDSTLRIDTARVAPTVDKEEVGRIKGVQVDCTEGIAEGIKIDGLHSMDLLRQRLVAEKIRVQRSNFHVFRDRRLPLEKGVKPLPMDYLKSLPVSIRVQSVKFGTTNFSYEEFPAKGNHPGTLRIVGLTGTLTPLINHPTEGDPAYLTMVTEGSLMGSGKVTATTKLPLHKGDPYKVEGAFHELDVTTLNDPAENLGLIHLQSGMLNMLSFQFEMNDEKSTGKIVGEYHNLVVQKLKEKHDEKKMDKLKSFALKEFIIPLNKDHTLPESKRSGKVDYKHDASRYFSYYLLHSLLVGVKSSFKLGFLLPG